MPLPCTAIPRSTGEDGATRARRLGETVPLRRIGTPEDVAKLALFLVSDDASFITGAVVQHRRLPFRPDF